MNEKNEIIKIKSGDAVNVFFKNDPLDSSTDPNRTPYSSKDEGNENFKITKTTPRKRHSTSPIITPYDFGDINSTESLTGFKKMKTNKELMQEVNFLYEQKKSCVQSLDEERNLNSQLNETNKTLSSKLEECEAKNEELVKDLEMFNEELEKYRMEKELGKLEIDAKLTVYDEENQSYKFKLEECYKLLENEKLEKKRLANELEQIKQFVSKAKEIAELEKKRQEEINIYLQSENDRIQGDLYQLQTANKDLTSNIEWLEQAKNKCTQQLSNNEEENRKLANENMDLRNESRKVNEIYLKVSAENKKSLDEYEIGRELLSKIEAENADLKNENRKLNEIYLKVSAENKKSLDEYKRGRKLLSKREKEYRELADENADLKKKNDKLNEIYREVSTGNKKSFDEYEDKRKDQEKENTDLRLSLKICEKNRKEDQKKIRDLNENNTNLSTMVSNLEESLKNGDLTKKELEKSVNDLKNSLNTCQRSKKELEESLSNCQLDKNNCEETLTEMQLKLNTLITEKERKVEERFKEKKDLSICEDALERCIREQNNKDKLIELLQLKINELQLKINELDSIKITHVSRTCEEEQAIVKRWREMCKGDDDDLERRLKLLSLKLDVERKRDDANEQCKKEDEIAMRKIKLASMNLDLEKKMKEVKSLEESSKHDRKFVFSFDIKGDGTCLIPSSEYCNREDKDNFLKFWLVTVAQFEDDHQWINFDSELTSIQKMSRKVVVNFAEFNRYIDSLKQYDILNKRLKLAKETNHDNMLIYQTGPLYPYTFREIDISDDKFEDNSTVTSRRLRGVISEEFGGVKYVADMLEFLHNTNRFPAGCVYVEYPNRMNLCDIDNRIFSPQNPNSLTKYGFMIFDKKSYNKTKKYINVQQSNLLYTDHIPLVWFQSIGHQNSYVIPLPGKEITTSLLSILNRDKFVETINSGNDVVISEIVKQVLYYTSQLKTIDISSTNKKAVKENNGLLLSAIDILFEFLNAIKKRSWGNHHQSVQKAVFEILSHSSWKLELKNRNVNVDSVLNVYQSLTNNDNFYQELLTLLSS